MKSDIQFKETIQILDEDASGEMIWLRPGQGGKEFRRKLGIGITVDN